MSRPARRPPLRVPLERVLRPFQEFARLEASAGILLLACALAAMVWANSPLQDLYVEVWETHLSVGLGHFTLEKTLLHWINDGLMVIFFFVVGLEIKREIQVGELSSVRHATLPIMGAIGGVLFPAAIYAGFNAGGPGAAGWGIPMATDIAFAIGVLTLLGDRVPVGLKVFLTALAIVDDIAAVLVIAIFYTGELATGYLLWAGVVLALMGVANLAGVWRPTVYVFLGILLWFCVLKSGIHATIAGVAAAMMVPAHSRMRWSDYVERVRSLLQRVPEEIAGVPSEDFLDAEQQSVVYTLEEMSEEVQTPLQRLEHGLHPYVTFLIMPVFALANAGVTIEGSFLEALADPIGLGVIFGLIAGKQIGITLFSWAAVRLRMADLPTGATWFQLYGVGWIGGIGFTMSLFIAGLAFSDRHLLDVAKLGVLTASLVAGVVGFVITRAGAAPRPEPEGEPDPSAAGD